MPGDCLPEDLQVLWKEMAMNPSTFSPDQLRSEMERLQAGQKRKSIIFLGVMSMLIIAFASFFFLFVNTLARVGSILSVVGLAYWLAEARMARRRVTPEVAEADSVGFYRAELERRRDSCRGIRLWSRIFIAMPPWIIFNLGFIQIHPELAPIMWFDCGTIATAAVFIAYRSLSQARMYQHRIDMLDASQKSA